MEILIVIPARGGSKGIPRKNLRSMDGHPLIYYVINKALKSKFNADVYVTSDDEEILTHSRKFGARTIKRDSSLSQDSTTLDPVIFNAYQIAKQERKTEYDAVITMQPTSPILKTSSLDRAIQHFINFNLDTVISASDDTHLMWGKEKHFYPLYKKRLNRQDLPAIYKETGGFLITRSFLISKNNRIGDKLDLFLLDSGEEVDIDSYEDWAVCEYLIKRKKIIFVVTGNKVDGLGHVNRALLIANEIVDHEIIFVTTSDSLMAHDIVSSNNYKCIISDNLLESILKIKPNLVINDILDTSAEYIQKLKSYNYKVINFEDLGEGAIYADMVINALYSKKKSDPKNFFSGEEYFCLRNEFVYTKNKIIYPDVKNILVTFGGTDQNNLTKKVLQALEKKFNNIMINVVLGVGYEKIESIEAYKDIKNFTILSDIKNISDYIYDADIVITASGRTVFEIASIGTPAIVIAQNNREMMHPFANEENGLVNLGLHSDIKDDKLINSINKLISSKELRIKMNTKMLSLDFKKNKKKVIKMIRSLIN